MTVHQPAPYRAVEQILGQSKCQQPSKFYGHNDGAIAGKRHYFYFEWEQANGIYLKIDLDDKTYYGYDFYLKD
ncbi:MAG: hypothetical protein F6K04_01490 [Leptolyngbya sp. SIO4C5]|nr:hypothetical protein [Leptolyngbya sp. SIO4C5]